MLTPEYLADCSEDYVALFSRLEIDICADIARRLLKAGHFTRTAMWQTKKLKEVRRASEGFARLVSAIDRDTGDAMRIAIIAAVQQSMKIDDRIHIAAGLQPTSISGSKALQEIILAGIQKTGGVMKNLTMTTAATATGAFGAALDRAYMQVMSGAFSYDSAMRMLINDLANTGYVQSDMTWADVYYARSKTSARLDVAARRALLTGINQTSAEVQLARMDELGTELVEVTSHAGARPSHAKWQGQVYRRKGNNPEYRDFVEATGYGSGDGLCGWNCRHNFFPYYEGAPRAFERNPSRLLGKSNDQVYEESQQQRYYERQVRDARRRCVTLDAAIKEADTDELRASLKSDFESASVLLKRRERRLFEFCEETDRKDDASRISVYGFGRSVSSKAAWAAKRAQSSNG